MSQVIPVILLCGGFTSILHMTHLICEDMSPERYEEFPKFKAAVGYKVHPVLETFIHIHVAFYTIQCLQVLLYMIVMIVHVITYDCSTSMEVSQPGVPQNHPVMDDDFSGLGGEREREELGERRREERFSCSCLWRFARGCANQGSTNKRHGPNLGMCRFPQKMLDWPMGKVKSPQIQVLEWEIEETLREWVPETSGGMLEIHQQVGEGKMNTYYTNIL